MMQSAPTPEASRSAPLAPLAPLVLVAEDEDALRVLLQYNLEQAGYRVAAAADGAEAERLAMDAPPDLALVDWGLPLVSGLDLCRRFRRLDALRRVPIIMLTARGEEADTVRGLDAGADDYMTKPFSMAELLARVRAAMRRGGAGRRGGTGLRGAGQDDRLRGAGIVLERAARRVSVHGRALHLGPTEFRLLEHLMRHPGRVFSRTHLLEAVWGAGIHVEPRTVDVHIGRLRKALGAPGADSPIRTVRAAGYAFNERSR